MNAIGIRVTLNEILVLELSCGLFFAGDGHETTAKPFIDLQFVAQDL